MTPREPDDDAMERAREEQRAADEARADKPARVWQQQADEIEGIAADAVERAAAMGDKVEPIPPPGEGPWHEDEQDAAEDARTAVVDPDDRDDPPHGGSAYAR